MSHHAGGRGRAPAAALDDELRRLGTSRRAVAVAAWERWRAEVLAEAAADGEAVDPAGLAFEGFHFEVSGAGVLPALRALPDGAGTQAALDALLGRGTGRGARARLTRRCTRRARCGSPRHRGARRSRWCQRAARRLSRNRPRAANYLIGSGGLRAPDSPGRPRRGRALSAFSSTDR